MASNPTRKNGPDRMFYMENGLMVFTEAYHLKRGYCCRSNCRHCPYGYRKPPSRGDNKQG